MLVRVQLLDALARNTTVTSLDMSGNSINDKGAEVCGSLILSASTSMSGSNMLRLGVGNDV